MSLINRYLTVLKNDNGFQKMVSTLKTLLINEENDIWILKMSEPMKHQIIYKTEDDKINFSHMTFEQKQNFVVKIICQMTNLSPDKDFCDWSTEEMLLYVTSEIVISILNQINFNVVCSKLDGYKSIKEILDIVLNPYNSF